MSKITLLLFLPALFAATDCLQPEAMFDVRSVSDAQIHPDGKTIAFIESYIDKNEDNGYSRLMLWQNGAVKALHTGKLHERSPRWSPDGRHLIYVSDVGGKMQTHLREFPSGSEKLLTHVVGATSALSWSPNGKSFAFFSFVPAAPQWNPPMPQPPAGAQWAPPPVVVTTLRYAMDGAGVSRPGSTHIFVVDVDSGAPRQISRAPYWHTSYISLTPEIEWTADSRAVIAAAIQAPEAWTVLDESNLYSFPASGDGVPKKLGSAKWHQHHAAASPDGKQLAWVGFPWKGQSHHVGQLYVTAGSSSRSLTASLDREPQQLVWATDSRRVWFLAEDQGDVNLYEAPLAGAVRKLTDRRQRINSFTVASTGLAAAVVSTPTQPNVLVRMPLHGKAEQELLYDPNQQSLKACSFFPAEEIRYKSFDGRPVQGWLLKPAGFDPKRKYPMIVSLHGGPHAMYANNFQHDLQIYAGRGYVVLYTNPRGSTGYGEDFARIIQHRWPGDDIKDVLAGVDHVIASGFVDPARLGLIGGSGGGLMTSWTVTQTDRFRAAVAWWPVTNWFTHVGSADNGFYIGSIYRKGMPWENPEDYMQYSPLFQVAKVKTPTMVICGDEDWRVPIAQSNEFYRALKIRGVDTVFVRMPGEAHGSLKRTSHRVAVITHSLAWLDRYLMPKSPTGSGE